MGVFVSVCLCSCARVCVWTVGCRWQGEGVDEVGVNAADPTQVLVRIDPQYFRPTEVRPFHARGALSRA